MKHWTSFLSESGTIDALGQSQLDLEKEISHYRWMASCKEHAFNKIEAELEQLALTEWTPAEIAAAKAQYHAQFYTTENIL